MDSPVFGILSRFSRVKQTSPGQWEAACPAHDDQQQSLCIGVGDNGNALVYCQAGCTTPDVLNAVGAGYTDLFPSPPEGHRGNGKAEKKKGGKVIARHVFNYHDAAGNVVSRKIKVQKEFENEYWQEWPDGKGGWRTKNLGNAQPELFRLPELLQAPAEQLVIFCEGEKDVLNVVRGGFLATSTPGGALKAWQPQFSAPVRGRHVVILPDYDKPEKNHPNGKGWD